MEKATVMALLEKYWQAQTTIGEEQALAAYFQGVKIDEELLPYRDLFAYFREESEITAGPDFGERILHRLGMPVDGVAAAHPMDGMAAAPATPWAPAVDQLASIREPFKLGVVAAAAVIMLLVAGLFLLTPAGGPTILASTAAHTDSRSVERPAIKEIQDTYDDPEKALAAVRHALLIASHHLNQGRRQLIGTHK